jgi:crotonobetainyl-CoA:carnitine CoA-transferase CaiB-like acyl-CoA transferase
MSPLAGIRVVEIAQNLAGPFAGQILAMLGAEVIKLERPEGGDDARGWGPPMHEGTATTFIAVNRGKRSLSLDLRNDADRALLMELLGDADVVVQNMRPGALEDLGLGGAALTARFPRLIYASLGAFGAVGPKALHPGYEPILQGYSGLMMMNGAEGGPPTRSGVQILDLGTGMWAVIGILAAIERRHTTGKGGVVDTSLLETALGWMGPHFAGFTVSGRPPPRNLSGNPNTVVFQSFETATAPVMVAAANDRLFRKLCDAMGLSELGSDERFASNRLRVANKPALMAVMEPAFRARPAEAWLPLLEAAGIPCGPINTMREIAEDDQVAALGIVAPVPGLPVRAIGLPISFDGERPQPVRGVPAAGEDSDDIRSGLRWAPR